jgi:hypothetical protein
MRRADDAGVQLASTKSAMTPTRWPRFSPPHRGPTRDEQEAVDAAFFEAARTRCGVDAWNAAADEGAALSFEHAITYALQEPRAEQ